MRADSQAPDGGAGRPGQARTPAEVRAFFGPRAATWEDRFPDDGPAYAAAVAGLGLRPGDRVLDAGCGTGRALPPLREAVGPTGTVLGIDVTPEMLDEVAAHDRHHLALPVLGDVTRLPLRPGVLDAVFAAGLLTHLPDPLRQLTELARVVRPGGMLALFHPLGRAALAARKGYPLTDEDLRAEPRLTAALAATGWDLRSYVDEDARFLAVAVRRPDAADGPRPAPEEA
ncbi:class I SAM-dependent methyltransferase [Streptomyces sp. NPDC059740]|uniref:class I SAM-dependent methyltransferase n=1 Tax=Streptomyces sp. NPDC059740 TaxID=3346926 RepID=UPI0036584F4D